MLFQSESAQRPNGNRVFQQNRSYAVFDLNAKYDLNDRTELAFTINNVLNKKYYATTGFYDTVVYGDERSAELTLRAKF